MLITRLRTFFFHIPRCGGSSINKFFLQNGFIPRTKLTIHPPDPAIMYGKLRLESVVVELDHVTWDHFVHFCSDEVQRTYRKLAVVRDPIDRARSVFLRMKLTGDKRMVPLKGLRSFDDWVDAVFEIRNSGLFDRPIDVERFPHSRVSHLLPQTHYIARPNGEIAVDELIRFDELSASWPAICTRIGIDDYENLPHKLPVANATRARRPDFARLLELSAESRAKLELIYADDFPVYGNLEAARPPLEVSGA